MTIDDQSTAAKEPAVKDVAALKVDATDLEILAYLQSDARAKVGQIAADLGIPQATVSVRLQRLWSARYIQGYHAAVDYESLGWREMAYVELRIQGGGRTGLEEAAQKVKAIREVVSWAWVTGEFDALLVVQARDRNHLREVLFSIIEASGPGATTRTAAHLGYEFQKPGVSVAPDKPSEKTLR